MHRGHKHRTGAPLSRKPTADEYTPSTLASLYEMARYRLRLVRYRISLASRPPLFDILAFLLAILGASSAINFLLSASSLDGLRLWAALASAAFICSGAVIGRWSHRPQELFRLASATEEATERLRLDMQAGMRNDNAYDALYQIYDPIIEHTRARITKSAPDRLLEVPTDSAGRRYLVAVVPATPKDSLDELIEPECEDLPADWHYRTGRFAGERQQYMRRLRRSTKHGYAMGDEEGDNLALHSLKIGNSLSMRVVIATYGEIVRTSDSLLNEFAIFAFLAAQRATKRSGCLSRLLKIGSAISPNPRHTLKALPWRRQVHSWSPDQGALLIEPSGRAAGLGVAVAMLSSLPSGENAAFTTRRSSRVGTYPDVRHVVPSGMCNTRVDMRRTKRQVPRGFVTMTMLGELLEESFDLDDASNYSTNDWESRISSELSFRGLHGVQPIFTGIAFDLLNLRPEICAQVATTSAATTDQAPSMKLCWEYTPLQHIESQPLAEIETDCPRTDFVQTGIACMALARRLDSS